MKSQSFNCNYTFWFSYTINAQNVFRKNNKRFKKFKNVEIIYDNKHYDYGLSIYYTKKLKLKKYKIYNFHLGNLYNLFFFKILFINGQVSI